MAICRRCNGDHSLPSDEQSLTTNICYWRNELEGGWVLDDIIAKAKLLESELATVKRDKEILLDGIKKIIEMDKDRGPFTEQAIPALARIVLSRIERD